MDWLKEKISLAKIHIDFPDLITAVWAFAMLLVFPLYLSDRYVQAMEDKYGFFMASGALVAALLIVYGFASGKLQKLLPSWKAAWKNWSMLDRAMVIFFLVGLISTLQAYPYMYQAFFGNEGRYVGLLYMLVILAMYFAVSRNLKYRKAYLVCLMLSGIILCGIVVLEYLEMDPLAIKRFMPPADRPMFVSTIGNVNFTGAVCCLYMAVGGAAFVFTEEKLLWRILYYIAFLIAMEGMLMAHVDNVFLAFAAFFAFMPLAAFRKRQGIRRYALLLATFAAGFVTVRMANQFFDLDYTGWSSLLDFVVDSSLLIPAAGFLWIVAIALYAADCIGHRNKDALAPCWVRRTWLVLLIIIAAAAIALLVKANISPKWAKEKLGGISSFLIIDDNWGNYRGLIWKLALKDFGELPWYHKLFGTGPDTFGIYMVNNHYTDMVFSTGQYYDVAHNEYINYLFCCGIFGIISLLGVYAAAIYEFIRNMTHKHGYVLAGMAFAVLCYAVQAFVNIAIPISGGLFWSLIAFGSAVSRGQKNRDNQEKTV